MQGGVYQGCILSMLLFNLHSDATFKEASLDMKVGIKFNTELTRMADMQMTQ